MVTTASTMLLTCEPPVKSMATMFCITPTARKYSCIKTMASSMARMG